MDGDTSCKCLGGMVGFEARRMSQKASMTDTDKWGQTGLGET